MRDPDTDFQRWRRIRKKGLSQHVIKTTLATICYALVGNVIVASFNQDRLTTSFHSIAEFAAYSAVFCIGVIGFNLLNWYWNVHKYKDRL